MKRRMTKDVNHSLTTEQLLEKVLQDIEEMSPEEKAELREHLDKAFGLKLRGLPAQGREWIN